MNTNEIAVNMEKLAIELNYDGKPVHGILVNAFINTANEHLFDLLGENGNIYRLNKAKVAKKNIKALTDKVNLLLDMKEAKRQARLQAMFNKCLGV